MHLRPMSNVRSQSIMETSTKHCMHRRGSPALILIAIFFVVGELGAVRGDNVLEADGPGQNLISIDKIYSTSTAQPAMLAIHGGTILSIHDLIAILPPGGLTGLQAQGIGSRITAENLRILALGVRQTGIVGARGIDGGSVVLDNGKIEIVGDNSFGLFADNGKIFGTNLTIATSGRGAAGAEADNGGSIQLNGGSITTAGVNAYGAFASGAGSSIAFTNSDVLSSQGSGASVDNGARLTLAGSSLTALVHGIVATRGSADAPNSIVVSGGNLITVFGDAFQVQNGAANITVINSATVTGNSALLRVLDPASATIVNFNASHASLFGDIFADPASQTTVNLTDSTVLTGKVNPMPLGLGVDMRIDGSSQWVLTGSSNVKSLSVSPGADILFRPPFDVRKTLTLGRLSGTGGTFGMNIDLRREVGDLIDITGASAGSHLLTFFDRGAGTDLRANAALLVVRTSDGVAGFSGMIDRAVFKYYVVHGDGSSATPIPDDWYLVRADRIVRDQVIRPSNLPAGSVNTPLGLSPVDALSNAANAAIGTYAAGVPLFYADMDTLIQRLGELRFLPGDGRPSVDSNGKAVLSAPPEETYPTIGTWVRGFGNGMRINDQVSRAYNQNTGGFQLGADKRFVALQGDLYLGGFLSYFNASRDFLDGGDGSTNAFSVGTYAAWLNPKGWYADLVLKYTQLWDYFHTPLSNGSVSTGDYSIPSLGGSLEVGKRFDVGKFFIEPQAQLAGVWEAGNNYTTSNGLMVGGSDQFSLRGRLGLRAGMDFAFSNGTALEPYLKVSAVHEFLGGDRITANEIGFNPALSGTLVDAGAGLAVRLNQSVYLYGEYDYANGDKIRAPWAVNAGLRWQWGGKPEEATMVEQPLAKQLAGKEEAKVVEQPSVKTTEPWQISVGGPGWLAGVTGTTGFHGVNSDIAVDVGQILRHINVIYSFAGEVRRDRFGVLGDLLYLNGQAGASGTGLVSKVDLGLQQFIGEFFGSWRVVHGPRGWLDLLAGFRYTYLGEQVGLQANNLAIDAASTNLVDRFAQQLATPSSDLRTLIQQNIVDKLTSLRGQNPTLPVGPIAGGEPGTIRDLVQQLIQSRQPELAAAIRTGAQARVNQIKAQLASQVANTLTGQLSRSFSFYDDWFDPVIGLRGRFNLTKAFYLTAESDVGGFGIGSDIAVQEYGALGCQVTRCIHAEVGYRYLYDEFRDESSGDFLYKMSLRGPQITAGLNF